MFDTANFLYNTNTEQLASIGDIDPILIFCENTHNVSGKS